MNIKLNNQILKVEENKSIIELFNKEIGENKRIITCNINNEIKSLNYIPKENDNVNF